MGFPDSFSGGAMKCFFFFQAEDGIRDLTVTGVQTCALPISAAGAAVAAPLPRRRPRAARAPAAAGSGVHRGRRGTAARLRPDQDAAAARPRLRSEERRGGEEGRSRWAPDHLKKKKTI